MAMNVKQYHQKGFTLVELVVSIVVTAIALTYLSVVFFSAPERSVEPMLQIRAAELGQSLMDEILAKAYDEKTPVGGIPACNPCTDEGDLGAEVGESRTTFNDVDDYDSYCNNSDPYEPVEDALGNQPGEGSFSEDFANFRMSICVVYDGNYDGTADSNQAAKLITVDVYPPAIGGTRQQIRFKAYRSNF
jgi:MSHA pilin protein MshD